MDARTLVVELMEKMGLIAAAALVAVLFPPLRNRVLGVGQRRDKLAAVALGLVLSIWGALLGFTVMGEHMNVRAIGVLIAAILGGWKAGALAGLGGGLFTAARVDAETAPWVLAASIIDGVIAGIVVERRPDLFQGWKAFVTSAAIQGFHLVLVGMALLLVGHAARYLPAWPAHVVKLLVNASGVTLFVVVARLVVAREEAAVALVEARSAANASALEALRRRLEPHFLFNALNALRATIRRDPGRARDLVNDLSDLYRYLLSHPENASVRDEVAHATAFLAIERARLGDDKLTIEVDVAPEAAHLEVPALLLQPLVENAVKHGVAAHEGPGRVTIGAVVSEGVLRIAIEDHVGGAPRPLVEAGSGIALSTLRQRLERRYGASAELSLEPTGSGMRALLCLPASTDAEDRGRDAA